MGKIGYNTDDLNKLITAIISKWACDENLRLFSGIPQSGIKSPLPVLVTGDEIYLLSLERQKAHIAVDQQFDAIVELFRKNNSTNTIISTSPNASGLIIEWKKEEKILEVFWKTLKMYELIKCDWDFFKAHFMEGYKIGGKIQWYANTNELAYIIDCFRTKEIIAKHKHPHKQVKEHFLDQFGKEISSRVLASSLDKGIRNQERQSVAEIIISTVSRLC